MLTTVATAAMSWAVSTTHVVATSSPVATAPASMPPSPVMGKSTVRMGQMRWTACASHPSPPVPPSSTCASQATASTSARCAMDKRTARTTATKKAAVRCTELYFSYLVSKLVLFSALVIFICETFLCNLNSNVFLLELNKLKIRGKL